MLHDVIAPAALASLPLGPQSQRRARCFAPAPATLQRPASPARNRPAYAAAQRDGPGEQVPASQFFGCQAQRVGLLPALSALDMVSATRAAWGGVQFRVGNPSVGKAQSLAGWPTPLPLLHACLDRSPMVTDELRKADEEFDKPMPCSRAGSMAGGQTSAAGGSRLHHHQLSGLGHPLWGSTPSRQAAKCAVDFRTRGQVWATTFSYHCRLSL